jgi:hypothetical protein
MKGISQMTGRKVSDKHFKPVCSISYLCQYIVGLSRAQFYNLQREKVFPTAQTDTKTGRKYFTLEQQKECYAIRISGISNTGEFYLFYAPRTSFNPSPQKKPTSKIDPKTNELVDTLNNMGLDVNAEQVYGALKSIYPEGYDKIEDGLLVRQLYRFLKQNS